MFPYEPKEGAEPCPNCERCDLTDKTFCNDCGYDKRIVCPECRQILIPAQVAQTPHVFKCESCKKAFTIEDVKFRPAA